MRLSQLQLKTKYFLDQPLYLYDEIKVKKTTGITLEDYLKEKYSNFEYKEILEQHIDKTNNMLINNTEYFPITYKPAFYQMKQNFIYLLAYNLGRNIDITYSDTELLNLLKNISKNYDLPIDEEVLKQNSIKIDKPQIEKDVLENIEHFTIKENEYE